MNNRERFLKIGRFERTGDVFLRSDWQWYWDETLVRWRREGMPRDQHVSQYFGFEYTTEFPMHRHIEPEFESRILSEDATTRTIIDGDGAKKRTLKEHREFSMDQWLEYPVRDRKTWQEYKKRLNPHDTMRYPLWWPEDKQRYKNRTYPLGIDVGSFFGRMRDWMGLENLSYTIADDPALIGEMEEYFEYFIIELIKPALKEVQFDFAHFWEDMAYKNGSMVSEKFFRQYMMPHYKKVTDLLHQHGIDIITLDSDGDIAELIPLWLESGINGVMPNEVNSGMQIVELRKQYGKDLIIGGGIDKKVLARTKRDIEKEVMSKVPYMLAQGGYFSGIDHSVPHDVPFENYQYYLELVRKAGS